MIKNNIKGAMRCMSIIIRAPDLSENDKQYDDCGITTKEILEIKSISIT